MAAKFSLTPDAQHGYSVINKKTRRVVYFTKSRTAAIVRAQMEEGFEPIDGKWETYQGQLAIDLIKEYMLELEKTPNPLTFERLMKRKVA